MHTRMHAKNGHAAATITQGREWGGGDVNDGDNNDDDDDDDDDDNERDGGRP